MMRVRSRWFCRNWKPMRHASELPPSDFISRRREVPFSPDWRQVFEQGEGPVPETDMQALMEAAPNVPPATSKEHTAAVRERIVDALESLEPRKRWIFEARAFRGLSIRQIGRELTLSKSYVDRIFKAAQLQVQAELLDLVEGE